MSQFLRDLCAGLCLICVCGVTFFFSFTSLNNYYMSNYFSEPQSGILFKAFVFIVTWKYAIGVIKCSILLPELFI